MSAEFGQGIGMKSGKPSSRKRALTTEEAELWAHVTRDAKALKRRRVDPQEQAGETVGQEQTASKRAGSSAVRTKAETPSVPSAVSSPSVPTAPRSKHSSPPPLARFDEKHRRKISRNGDLHIDARIDLHGMRQRQAHAALRGFLLASVARGDRNVLVITGKGTSGKLERTRDFYSEERGVLRRLVPQWLAEQEFRSFVVSYTTASIRHGGEGALYVRLRKL